MSGLIARAATYLTSGLLSQGVTFALWLAIPWFLPPAEMGQLTIALFYVEVLAMLALLGMDAALLRFGIQAASRGNVFGVAVLLATSGTIFVAIAGVTGKVLGLSFISESLVWVSNHSSLVLSGVAVNVAWSLVQSIQMASRNAKAYAIFQVTRSLIQFGLVLGTLTLVSQDAHSALGAMIASTALVMGLLIWSGKLPKPQTNPLNQILVRPMAHYGLSMMAYGLLGVLINYTQRLVVSEYTDMEVLGIFAYFNAIALQANGLWGALNKAWTPEFFAMLEKDRVRALKLLRGLLVLLCMVFPVALCCFILLSEVFLGHLLFPKVYADRMLLLWELLLGHFFIGMYTVAYPLYYYKLQTSRLLFITLFLAVSNLTISVILIGTWGAEGAAVSILIFSLLSTGIYFVAFRDWIEGKLPMLLLVVSAMIITAGVVLVATQSLWSFVLVLLATSSLSWAVGRTWVRPIVKYLLQQ